MRSFTIVILLLIINNFAFAEQGVITYHDGRDDTIIDGEVTTTKCNEDNRCTRYNADGSFTVIDPDGVIKEYGIPNANEVSVLLSTTTPESKNVVDSESESDEAQNENPTQESGAPVRAGRENGANNGITGGNNPSENQPACDKLTPEEWGNNTACRFQKMCQDLENINITTEIADTEYPGSSSFKACQHGADKDWKELVSDKNNFNRDAFKGAWKGIIGKLVNECNDKDYDKDGEFNSFVKRVADSAKSKLKWIQSCSAFVVATSLTDTFSDASDLSGKEKYSLDKKIACYSRGAETQDYKGCKNLINAYDAAIVSQKAMESLQSIDQMKTGTDSQITMLQTQTDDPAAALKAMKTNIDKQKDIATQTTGFHAVKLAALFATYQTIPTKKDVYDTCLDSFGNGINAGVDTYNEIAEIIRQANPPSVNGSVADLKHTSNTNPNYICAEIAGNNQIMRNGKARDAAKVAMVEAGVDAAKFGAITAMLDHQIGDVQDAINAVDEMVPTDTAALQQQDLIIDQCQADPTLEICQTGGYINPIGFTSFDYSMGSAGGDTVIQGSTDGSEDNPFVAETNSATDRSGISSPLGEIPGDIDRGSDFLGPAPAAAEVKPGSGGGGSGGGSGGGAGGGGLIGGAVAGQPTEEGGREQKITESSKQYKRGRGLAYSSRGGTSKKSKKEENPFAKMFNKKVPKKTNKNSLYFGNQIQRGPASLFSRITNRYGVVAKEKRLLEYKIIKRSN